MILSAAYWTPSMVFQNIRITSQNTHIALSWPHLVFYLRHLLTFGAKLRLHHSPYPSFEIAHW
jgi:hypothetical protein